MKQLITILFLFLLISILGYSQPTDNPFETYYTDSEGYPTWTKDVKWTNVITMTNKGSGTANFTEFETKRDLLYSQGGGVLYYPAGTWDFTVATGINGRGLLLKEGVVIRGVAPTTDKNAVKTYDTYGLSSLTTIFKFSGEELMRYIGCTPASTNKVGICWVKTENAYIYFGYDLVDGWAATWSAGLNFWIFGRQVAAWNNRVPNGTLIMDPWMGSKSATEDRAKYGSKRFVFGCNLTNAWIKNYAINKGKCSSFSADAESWRFGGVVSMYGHDIFFGNNVMPKTSSSKDNRLCLDINKQLLPSVKNRCAVALNEGLYALNVVVKGNWLYNQGNKTYEVSGKYAIIKNNMAHKDPISGTPNFNTCEGGTVNSDYMNRAFDLGGQYVWVNKNEYHGTGSGGNDGEGILGQRHNETEIFSHAWIDNTGSAEVGADDKGYIAAYDMHCQGFFLFKNVITGTRGMVGIRKPDFSQFSDITILSNTAPKGTTGTNVNDCLSSCPSTPTAPTNVKAIINPDGTNTITWVDNSDDEIGFRVQRRVNGGTAHTITYMARNSEGSNTFSYNPTGSAGGTKSINGYCATPAGFDFNEQKWIDFLCPVGKTVEYRVVAINCSDNDNSASGWVTPTSVEEQQIIQNVLKFSYSPNPTTGIINLDGIQNCSVKVLSLQGFVVKEVTTSNMVDISDLVNGIYLLEVTKDNNTEIIKIIKE